MDSNTSRRLFLKTAAVAAAGHGIIASRPAAAQEAAPRRGAGSGGPIVIASANGLNAVARAMERLKSGDDPLDAVIAGVNLVEDDPNDHSVGLGGLPNEDGVVELDSSVMHGPTHKAGAVAALRNIRNPSRVARLVMQRTDHVLLVGEGALRFARAHGFKEEELLTDEARRIWLDWKEHNSDKDNWLPAPTSPPTSGKAEPAKRSDASEPRRGRYDWREHFTYGTINCLGLNRSGDLGGVTTTSGLSWKLPGRVGDSPIIGAGLYVDNGVGAAGSTGRGEANLQNCSSFAIVEMMSRGMEPAAACLEQLRRVARTTEPRLRDARGRPSYDLKFYALRKDGAHGSASMWSSGKSEYAVCDGQSTRKEACAVLYQRAAS